MGKERKNYNYLYIIIFNSIITMHTGAYRTEKFAPPKPPRNILNRQVPISELQNFVPRSQLGGKGREEEDKFGLRC